MGPPKERSITTELITTELTRYISLQYYIFVHCCRRPDILGLKIVIILLLVYLFSINIALVYRFTPTL